MSAFPVPADAIVESERLIAALERHRAELPFADAILAIHLPTHRDLESSRISSERAVNDWRLALARRWEYEVTGRRLYKVVLRQLAEHYGESSAPEVKMLSRGGAEIDSSPSELLADLRRIHAALALGADALPFATQRLAEVERACAKLEQAITEVSSCEARRRSAVIDRRLAQEAYRRVRASTRRTLAEHCGGAIAAEFAELFG